MQKKRGYYTFIIIKPNEEFVPCLVLSRLELLRVSGFLGVLLLPPVSPVPRGPSRLKSLGSDLSTVLFCDFPSSSVSTHDRLPCFLHLH